MFAAGAALALLDAALRADPPAAGALRARLALQSAAASAKMLRLNNRRERLYARPALRRWPTRLGPPRTLCRCGAIAPAGRPASTPTGSPPRRRRLDLALPDPNGPRIQPEGLRRGGRSGFGRRVRPSPSSRTLRRPTPKSSPLSLFDLAIAIRLRWPRPVPLIAVKILIRPSDPRAPDDGQGRGPSLAERRRRRDRAGRRLGSPIMSCGGMTQGTAKWLRSTPRSDR